MHLYNTRRRYKGRGARFYELRGDCYWGIGWMEGAALDYRNALDKSDNQDNALLHAKLGAVYSLLDMDDKALHHCRIAYDKDESTVSGLHLAHALYATGDIDEFKDLCLQLQPAVNDAPPALQNDLTKLMILYFMEIDQESGDSIGDKSKC